MPGPPPPRPEPESTDDEAPVAVTGPVIEAVEPTNGRGNGNGTARPSDDAEDGAGERRPAPLGTSAVVGELAGVGARPLTAGARAPSTGGWRARRQQLALAPVRLGTLSPRQLDRHAGALNIRRIGKLEPGFKTWRRLWSLVVLLVIVAVIAVAVAAALDLIVTALSVAANHAISKSAGQ